MLTKIKFAPGIDKQDTAVGAEGRWVDSDNVRFRYGLPEKVGGWQSLLTDSIVGVARKQHAFVDNKGNRYVAIGTDKFLLIYFEGQLFDITPFRCNNAGVIDALTSSTLATNSTTVKTCTITTTTDHDLSVGDIVELSSVTLPSGTGLNGTDFEDKLFQVLSVPTPTTFTIDSLNQATAVISTGGTMTVKVYETVGPAAQTYGYGYGVGNYGGNITGALQNDLDGALAADSAGNNGSGTQIRLTSTTGFPTTGTIAVGNELITYTNIAGNELTGISRGALGTATTGTINGQAHSDGAVVTNATEFTGWGSAVEASTVTLEPGLWSLSNFGQVLVSTIANGKTFTWDSSIAARLSTHSSMTTSGFETRIDAATDSGNPTATRVTLISPTTRHLIHLGTETTIGDTTTQDDMFIRFSEDEGINKYTPQATNTAGTQRLTRWYKNYGRSSCKRKYSNLD